MALKLRQAGLAVGLILAGCGAGAGPGSELKHDAGAPVRDAAAWNWFAATDADYANIVAPLVGVDATKILPNEHPLVVRSQFWLDRIDDFVRGTYPAALANVPKPRIRVINNAAPNAFVAPVFSCFSAPLKLPKRDGAEAVADAVYLDVRSGQLASLPTSYPCLQDGTNLATLKAMLPTINKRSACQYSIDDDGALVVDPSCKLASDFDTIGSAKAVFVAETAGFVSVFSPIMGIMPENEFVAVLAHELGHYYRSHSTSATTDYDIFYTMHETETDHKPVAEPALNAIGQAAVDAATHLDSKLSYAQVDGQRYPSEFYFAIGTLVVNAAANNNTTPECQAAAMVFKDEAFQSQLDRFPNAAKVSETVLGAYHRFESLAHSCLSTLALVPTRTPLTAAEKVTSFAWEDVTHAVLAPSWPAWTKDGELGNAGLVTLIHVGLKAPPAQGLDAYFSAVQRTFQAEDEKADAALAEAQAKHVGMYTIEQEADDESAEWIAGMGFDPETEVGTMHSLGLYIDSVLPGQDAFHDLNTPACDALRKNHWLNAAGSYQYPVLGDLTDPHHGICFREFNIERDAAAHHEVASKKPLPVAPGPSWVEVEKTANDLLKAFQTTGADSFAAMMAKPTNPVAQTMKNMGCIYTVGLK